MTKQVRIENADMTDHKIVVEAWAKGVNGASDTLVGTTNLDHPTALATLYVWKDQYLIIKEIE